MERSSGEALVFEVLIQWRSARNVTPSYEWAVAGRLVTDRVAQGDDLGRFSSKYCVHIREGETISCLPPIRIFIRKAY